MLSWPAAAGGIICDSNSNFAPDDALSLCQLIPIWYVTEMEKSFKCCVILLLLQLLAKFIITTNSNFPHSATYSSSPHQQVHGTDIGLN